MALRTATRNHMLLSGRLAVETNSLYANLPLYGTDINL